MRSPQLVALIALLTCSSCTSLTRQNPFDPDAPDTFKAPATIQGVVFVDGRTDSSEALVSVVGVRSYTTPANVDGSYSIGGVLPGTYKVTATLVGFRSTVSSLTVKAGDTVTADDLQLSEARGTLRGLLVSQGSAATESLGGAIVNAIEASPTRQTPRSVSAVSNLDGSFTLRDVPLGAYRIAVSRGDLAPVCVSGVSLQNDGGSVDVAPITISRADALLRVVDSAGTATRYTNTRSITVEINSVGATGMKLAETSEALSSLTFSPLSAAQTFELTAGEGAHTLYAQLLDGCAQESKAFTTTVTLDTTAPTGIVTLAEGADYLRSADGNTALAIAGVDASPITLMKLSLDGTAPSIAQPYVTSLVAALGAAEGPKTVRAILVDAAGNESSELVDTITKDSIEPVMGTPPLTIAEQEGLFIRLTATPTLGDEPATVAMSNYPTTAQGPFSPFSTDLPWLMAPGGDGPRTVYVRFADAAGNTTQEYAVAVTIDQSAPESPVVVIEDGALATSRTSNVKLGLSVIDPDGGTEMRVSNCPSFCTGGLCDACCHTRDYAPLATTLTDWSFVGCSEGPVTVYAQYRDARGNQSAIVSDGVVLDTTAPTISSFVLAPVGASGAVAINTPSVLAAISASDGTQQPTTMALANLPDGTANCSLLNFAAVPSQPYAPFVTHLLQGGDGSKAVCVQVRDLAGNVSVSQALACALATGSCDDIFLDTVAPDAATLNQGNSRTAATSIVVAVTNTLNDPVPSSGDAHYEVRGGQYTQWTSATPPFSFTLNTNQQNIISVRTVDAANNASSSADLVVVHDDRPPRAPFIVEGSGKRGTLTFSWLRSPDVDVDHYLVHYGNFPGVYTGAFAAEGLSPLTVAGSALSARITQAPDQSTVYVAVSAVDSTGLEGDSSNELAISNYDASPQVAGFFGGTVHSSVIHNGYVVNRTSLGVETFALTDTTTRVSATFSPIAEVGVSSTTPVGRMNHVGDLFFLVQNDRLELLQFNNGSLSPRGVITFAPGRYTNAIGAVVAGVTYVYLTGDDAVGVYDVTVSTNPELVGATTDVDVDHTPSWFHPRDVFFLSRDFGAGEKRYLISASAQTPSAFAAVDVTNPAVPMMLTQSAVQGTIISATIANTMLLFSTGKMMNGQDWVEAMSFDGSQFAPICRPSTDCAFGGTGCGGDFSQCDYLGRFGGGLQARALSVSPDLTTLHMASGFNTSQLVESYTLNGVAQPTLLTSLSVSGAGQTTGLTCTADRLVLTSRSTQNLLALNGTLSALDQSPLVTASSLNQTSTRQAIAVADGRVTAALNVTGSFSENLAISSIDMSRVDQPRLDRTKSATTNTTAVATDLYMVGSVGVVANETGFVTSLATFAQNAPTTLTLASSSGSYGAPFVADGGIVYASGSDGGNPHIGVFALDSRPSSTSLARVAVCTPTFGESGAARDLVLSSVEDGIYTISSDGTGTVVDRCWYKFDPGSGHSCECQKKGDISLPFTNNEIRPIIKPPYAYYFDGDSLVASFLSDSPAAGAVLLGSLPLGAAPMRLLEAPPYLVTLTSRGLSLVDISNPAQMKFAGTFGDDLRCLNATIENQRLYCASDGVVAFDLPTSDAPTLAGAIAEVDTAYGFAARAGSVVRTGNDTVVRSYVIDNMALPTRYTESDVETDFRSPGALLAVHPSADILMRFGGNETSLRWDRTGAAPTLVNDRSTFITSVRAGTGASLHSSGGQLFLTHNSNSLKYINIPFGTVPFGYDEVLLGDGAAGAPIDRATSATSLANRLYVSATMYTTPNYGNPGDGLLVYDLPGMTLAGRWRFASLGAEFPAHIDAGFCTSALVPCVVYRNEFDNYSGRISLIDANDPSTPIKRQFLIHQSPTWEPAFNLVVDQQLSNASRLYLSGPNGFSVWEVDDAWNVTKRGEVAGSHGFFLLDETAQRVVVSAFDEIRVINVSNPMLPVVTRTLRYPGLGFARSLVRKHDRLFVSFTSGVVRVFNMDIDADTVPAEASDFDGMTDMGGHAEALPNSAVLAAEQKYVLAGLSSDGLGGGSAVTAMKPNRAGGSDGTIRFLPLPFHQYTPRSALSDVVYKSDRLYVCRQPNADEGNVTFEILATGLPSARPVPFTSMPNVPCHRLTVSGPYAWMVEQGSGSFTMRVYDLTNELAPVLLQTNVFPLTLASTVSQVVANGRYAYVNANEDGVLGIELTPSALLQRFTLPAPAGSRTVGLAQGASRLLVSFLNAPVALYDITSPMAPAPKAALNGLSGRIDLAGMIGFVTPVGAGATRLMDLR
jgi:hypothetical protein